MSDVERALAAPLAASRPEAMRMRIGELAERASTTTRALRYYESRGLLSARRDGSGYRTYDEGDLTILRQIRTLQDCGFELEEIRPFVDCLRAGHESGDDCPSSAEVYRRKLTDLDRLIDQLQGVRGWIAAQLAADRQDVAVPLCEFTAGAAHLEPRGRSAASDKGDLA